MQTEKNTYEDKQVYDLKDIMNILGIGRSNAYSYIQQVYKEKKPFRVLKIGANYKIPKKSFDIWLNELK